MLAVGLALLGVRYPLLVGALAAVLNVVPFVGSLVAAVLGILSALNESGGLALATVLLALFAGVHLAGLIGALVSVPFLAAVWEIVRSVYLQPSASRDP